VKHKYRSIFISDVHLGTKEMRNDYLLDFLNTVEAEYIYLVGDIVDFWKLKKSGIGRRSIVTSYIVCSKKPEKERK